MAEVQPFGAYLKRAMDAIGITIADLKRLTGISDSLISKWRAGLSQPSIENLRLMAPALRVPPMDLYVAAGHLTPEEAGYTAMPEPPRAPTVEEAIAADPVMSKQGKEAFLLIYRQFEERITAERAAERAEAEADQQRRQGRRRA